MGERILGLGICRNSLILKVAGAGIEPATS